MSPIGNYVYRHEKGFLRERFLAGQVSINLLNGQFQGYGQLLLGLENLQRSHERATMRAVHLLGRFYDQHRPMQTIPVAIPVADRLVGNGE